jgi:hypothetical protein
MVDLAIILCTLLKSYMEAHMVTLTYDYFLSYDIRLMCSYDLFRVAHYTIDMASNLYKGYGIEL